MELLSLIDFYWKIYHICEKVSHEFEFSPGIFFPDSQ